MNYPLILKPGLNTLVHGNAREYSLTHPDCPDPIILSLKANYQHHRPKLYLHVSLTLPWPDVSGLTTDVSASTTRTVRFDTQSPTPTGEVLEPEVWEAVSPLSDNNAMLQYVGRIIGQASAHLLASEWPLLRVLMGYALNRRCSSLIDGYSLNDHEINPDWSAACLLGHKMVAESLDKKVLSALLASPSKELRAIGAKLLPTYTGPRHDRPQLTRRTK